MEVSVFYFTVMMCRKEEENQTLVNMDVNKSFKPKPALQKPHEDGAALIFYFNRRFVFFFFFLCKSQRQSDIKWLFSRFHLWHFRLFGRWLVYLGFLSCSPAWQFSYFLYSHQTESWTDWNKHLTHTLPSIVPQLQSHNISHAVY